MTEECIKEVTDTLTFAHECLPFATVEDGYHAYMDELEKWTACALLHFKDNELFESTECLKKALSVLRHNDHGQVIRHLGMTDYYAEMLENARESILLDC